MRSLSIPLLWLVLLSMGLTASPSGAGTVSGVVRNAATLAPLAGIDLDVFDDRFRLEAGVSAITAADGSYTIVGVNGPVHVRADATVAQGFVDQYWPGSFLPAGAQLIQVGSNQDITGIDFALGPGVLIQGAVVTTDFGTPLAGCDLDVLALDGSFLSGIDAITAADGTYSLGLFPPGQYIVKADPSLLQGYVPEFHPGSFTFAGALPITVASTNVTNVVFAVEPGGQISGRVLETGSLLPAVGIDIDVFDPQFAPLLAFDGVADDFGDYTIGIVPVGTYYILADALFDQPWQDTYYGQASTLALATPITVTKGQHFSTADIQVQRLGFLSGTVTDAATGLPISGMDLDVTTTSGVLLPQYDATSTVDGTYRIGPIAPGLYHVRADATGLDPWADQYFPDSFSPTSAVAVSVSDSVVSGIDFALIRGGWIRGSISRVADASPAAGIDLDIFLPDGTPLPSIDADSDSLGQYRIGALPLGTYLLRADPALGQGLALQYWAGADTITAATPIQVLVGLDTANIDFSLATQIITGVTPATVAFEVLGPAYPNPFSATTSLRLRSGRGAPNALRIFDLRGRRVRTLDVPRLEPGRELLVQWDGRDERGHTLASGTYFLQLGTDRNDPVVKLLRLR